MSNATDTMTEADIQRLDWLYEGTADAKRAPELAVWILVLGPITVDELVAMRSERLGCEPSYARMSVAYDLGRIAGLGGPVEYAGGRVHFNETHRRAVMEWLYNFQVSELIRKLSRFTPEEGADRGEERREQGR